MNEKLWDKKLKINTIGRNDNYADEYNFPYEATPYSVLTRLANSGYITKEDVLLDYGCGKGRVDFFLNYMIGCKTLGIEFEDTLYQLALSNNNTYIKHGLCEFCCINAVDYPIKSENCFYFFNPFSIEIFKSVMRKIINSYYTKTRKIKLFFYYPNEEYIAYLMTIDEIMFVDEIDCGDLFEGYNTREKILFFEFITYT